MGSKDLGLATVVEISVHFSETCWNNTVMRNQSNREFFRDVESFFDSADQKEALTRKKLECTGLIAAERNTMSRVNGQWREREMDTKRKKERKKDKERKIVKEKKAKQLERERERGVRFHSQRLMVLLL